MSEKRLFSAYRLVRLSLKGVVKNVLSPKGNSKHVFDEKVKEYVLEIYSDTLTVYQVDFQGNRQAIHSSRLSEKERAQLLKKQTYKDKHYVYHIMEEVKK